VKLKHIIFDCDGVLVDSEPLSMRADVMLLNRYGIEISESEAHQRFVGTTFQAMLDMMTAQFGTVFPPDLDDVKNHMVEELYKSELLPVSGVSDVLHAIKVKNFSMSIASNSPRKRVELAVQLTGIADYFDAITSFEEVKQGKPAPDVFLKAAERAGAAPLQCLVIEDSLTGSTAALAAGMRTIGFTGTHADPERHALDLMALGVSVVVSDMRELLLHI
jgi:HAD superfamily hydrolase (TIGR01509 family)